MSAYTVKMGSIKLKARNLGTTKYCMGLVANDSRASICSVTCIEPISAAIAAPTLPATISAVITALVVAGRVGAAIAAEIGSMQVTEQIDALESFATSPIQYLVVPRFLALSLMLPILTVYADMIGIFGGYLVCVFKLGTSSSMYINIAFDALLKKDLWTRLVKTVIFGMIIAFVSCYEGFNVVGGAEGVGKATTRTVVNAFILIIMCDCFFTALFYFL